MERSGPERVMMASSMFETAKAMVLASLPTGLSEIEIKGFWSSGFMAMRLTPEHLLST